MKKGRARARAGGGENLKFTLFSEPSTRRFPLLLAGLDDVVYPSLYFQSRVSFQSEVTAMEIPPQGFLYRAVGYKSMPKHSEVEGKSNQIKIT